MYTLNSIHLALEFTGVVITKVFPKTPADIAGIRRLDVIVEIANKRVERADDAQRIIDGAKIGEVCTSLTLLIHCTLVVQCSNTMMTLDSFFIFYRILQLKFCAMIARL